MDSSIFRWINRLADRTGWAHDLFKANASYGIALFALLLLAAYIDGHQHGDLRAVAGSVWAGAAALIALGLGQLIGNAVNRARPYETMTGVHLLVDRTTDFSFPSDHATAVGAIAAGLLIANRRWGIIAAVLAAAMAFTRVYVGVHYPSDVLTGLALGAVVAWSGGLVAIPALTNIANWMTTTPLSFLVSRRTPRPSNLRRDDVKRVVGSTESAAG